MVVSRADELKLWTGCNLPVACDAEQALAIIHDLESALAQRDNRIAELEHLMDDVLDRARAAVPECYAEVIRALHAYCRGDDNDGDPLGHAIALVDGFSEDQLRACEIEIP
jgi:hypothetical protein